MRERGCWRKEDGTRRLTKGEEEQFNDKRIILRVSKSIIEDTDTEIRAESVSSQVRQENSMPINSVHTHTHSKKPQTA